MLDGYSKEAKIGVGAIIIFLAIILFLIFKPFQIVDSGNRGLVFTMGALSDEVKGEGVSWRVPLFQKIKKITIRPIQVDYTIEVGEDGAITKDNQTIGVGLSVFYKYDESRLVEMWRNTGEDKIKSIVLQTLKESAKKTIGEYTIYDIANNQEKIKSEIAEKFRNDLSTGNYPLQITEVKVTNYNWSDAFEAQIEETMKRAQEVKQKEQELLITEQEAQKLVKQAEAEKQSLITKAEGEKEAAKLNAEAKALEGEGIRKYNEEVAKNWDIELKKIQLEIEKERVERWDGSYVPNNMYGPIPVDTAGGIQGY
jgi:regulator of protease activity HflC (stomatin/prohibitin superfamily)